ncbi:MAG: DUF6249 domain-containing protein [Bacteroidales bacterium]|nr:DUF6249 domain-containing protein [Bacteroidales bacterium]
MSLNYLFRALPWIAFFAAITLSYIYYIRARNRERLALIEKGSDAPDAFREKKFPWLKIGIVITGVSIGVLLVIIILFAAPDNSEIRDAILILMVVSGLIFGGISMIIAHFVDRRNKE